MNQYRYINKSLLFNSHFLSFCLMTFSVLGAHPGYYTIFTSCQPKQLLAATVFYNFLVLGDPDNFEEFCIGILYCTGISGILYNVLQMGFV